MRVARDERRGARRAAWFGASALAVAATLLAGGGAAQAAGAEEPFAPVVHDVLAGDLVVAGNSNLVSAGGWRAAQEAVADVDGDRSLLCVAKRVGLTSCAENSSSATLHVPPGARIVAARLYVNTSLSSVAGAVRVRLDGPGEGFAYTELSATTPGVTKVRESAGTASRAAQSMRQAVWDVTGYVQQGGAGAYTVADIVFERTGAFLPYASWTIVAAYELDPAADTTTMTPEQLARFGRRAISWHDGFAVVAGGTVDVQVDGFAVPAGATTFAKTVHLAAHAQHRGSDSLLFAGQPLGNNVTPGDAAPPPGVVVGADPACNSTTDILNDSICVLGTPVATKVPGAADLTASDDGRRASSGSGVDFDVIRVPDRYLQAGMDAATLSLQSPGRASVAVGVLAASVDLPAGGGTS